MNGRNNFLKQKQSFMSPKRSEADESESDEDILGDESDENDNDIGRQRRDEEMKRFIRNHHLRFRSGRQGRSANNPELRKLLLLGR